MRNATREEDVSGGTDFWVRLNEEELADEGESVTKEWLMIQAKSFLLATNSKNVPVLIPLKITVDGLSTREKSQMIQIYAEQVADRIFNSPEWEGRSGEEEKRKRESLANAIIKLVGKSLKYHNVGAVLVVFPSFSRTNPTIKVNQTTGQQVVGPGERRVGADFQKILRSAYIK